MAISASTGRVPAALPPIVYERDPGAASRPLPAGYRRHEPEKTVLYQVVASHLETFLEEARQQSESGAGYPAFIERELRAYLDCGLLARGFSRLRCPECGFERLVAFSCKGRVCPSCWGRRMSDTAAHLVDRVLPQSPYRQWVLTFPWPLRLPLAVKRGLLSEMLRVFLRTLFAWQSRRGRALGIRDGQTGAVTFVQFFGGALNCNPHFHSILPDGLFVPGEQEQLTFVRLTPPSDDDISRLTRKLARKLTALAEHRLPQGEDLPPGDDEEALVHAALAEAQHVPRASPEDAAAAETQAKHCCANVEGFTMHAARTVSEHDRESLERLCKYGLRAPFAVERFSLAADGKVIYRLPKPWPTPHGQTELRLEPLALLRRLAALIPAPYFNLVRYHGVLANRSRFRKRLPPPPPAAPTEPPPLPATTPAPEDLPSTDPPPLRPRRLPWAQLLRRALHIDALLCPRCSVPMVVLAFISDPQVVHRILAHLKLPTSPPPLAPPRLAEQEEMFAEVKYDQAEPEAFGMAQNAHIPRGPPRP